ncbi:uncharacterized protein LOC121728418 isoform X2 [Aricia agestis]|uniref:uncharacterized protein LOC121728418 isoform X2 n=1 Tax=Aricia agestis TaxID=91739 RepID=UPI001C20B975|nr:uncharacterized protein LOC121728418 isoform X2 [Aricia agestis]
MENDEAKDLAQQDLGEPSSLFWKRMKEQNDSSDSGDRKTGSSTELCRISIKCSMEDPPTSKAYKNTGSDTESPPIISDDHPDKCSDSGDDSNKSDGEHSHKSIDMTLDTSLNRPHSPTSSITSQRKLEWDSLADVGYGNESDRKNSASSLSTLERLALHQQYSNNDTKTNSELGIPTAHSTPLDQTENKSKIKKDSNKKIPKFSKKDVDIMEVNIPNNSDNRNQPINVNLTKHISFNVEKDGAVKIDNMNKKMSISQNNPTSDALKDNVDKEIQTTLPRNSKDNEPLSIRDTSSRPRFPILINLNSIRNRKKKRKRKLSRSKKRATLDKENIPQEKSINQESDAESFEYMPGHVYNQNKLGSRSSVVNIADNKSSLESSAGHTTESSKDFQCTFTKELEKSIDLLKLALQHRYKNTSLKQKLVKEVVESLIQTKFKNDGSSNDIMCGSNRNILTASSTSESNNLDSKKPTKSLLQAEKFNSGDIATTSQSVPNLPTVSAALRSENISKPVNISSTDSDLSYKGKYLSEVFLANSSSEEIYKKYIIALKKENFYKRKLKEQELLLRQKTTQQDCQAQVKEKSNLDHLVKDLAKNNFADGSGDASNACPSSSNVENGSGQRSKSHTVFTLSSGNIDNNIKKNKKIKNRLESEINCSMETGSNTQCRGCSAYRSQKIVVTDSSVQVNFDSQCMNKAENINLEQNIPLDTEKNSFENIQENIKYVCLCTEDPNDIPDNFLIYRCSRMPSKCVMVGTNIKTNTCVDQKSENLELVCNANNCENKEEIEKKNSTTSTQSSQTHFSLPNLIRSSCNNVISSALEYRRSNKKGNDNFMASSRKVSCYASKLARITQTEISIDPKVSDPSISDVKLVEVGDYTDNEQIEIRNDVYKTSDRIGKEPDAEYVQPKNNASETPALPINKDEMRLTEKHEKLKKEDSKLISLQNLQSQSNFTIPIFGTNMTLKVSLDSRDSGEKKTKDMKHTYSQQSLGSNEFETLKRVEKYSQSENLRQKQTECVAVQTSNMRELENIDSDIKVCYTEAKDDQTPTTSAYRYESVDMRYSNTYPKEKTPKAPLLRSNTDSCLPIDQNNVNVRGKPLKEPTSQAGSDSSDKSQKEPFAKPKYELGEKEFIDCYTSMGSKGKNSKVDLSEKPLMEPTTEPNRNKKGFTDRQTSMSTKNDDSKDRTLDKPLLRTILDSDKREVFNRHPSKGKENNNLRAHTLQKPLVKSKTNTDKKDFIDRYTSMDKESGSSKEGTFKKSTIRSNFNLDEKKLFDHHTSMENEKKIITKEQTLIKPLLSSIDMSMELNKNEFSNRHNEKKSNNRNGENSKTSPESNIGSGNENTTAPNIQRDVNTQYDTCLAQIQTKDTATEITNSSKSSTDIRESGRQKSSKHSEKTISSTSQTDESKSSTQDPLLDIIRDITKRYSKKEIDKSKRKKCYAEIIAVLNYLLDTSETTENESTKVRNSSSEGVINSNRSPRRIKSDKPKKTSHYDVIDNKASTHDSEVEDKKKTFRDKSVQLSPRKAKQNKCCGESTDCPISTDIHSTSTDSTACKTQHKLKHHCDKHQCRSHCRKCDVSSSSSVNCECKHRCYCRGHKTHRSRASEKAKKCVAYNLILQTSDSVASEEIDKQKVERHLKNIVVKVPSKRRVENMQFKEVNQKIERNLPRHFAKDFGARSVPQDNEVSSTDNMMRNTATCTIRDYLEQNRPDFVERTTQRQSCLKLINEARASERATKRAVLSAHVDVDDADLTRLAEVLGKDLRTRKLAPKFISEKEMKKHSEKIYNSLPEVQKKKEDIKKERVKKTNLLMANMFKKNLQKKTLRGAVNLSNYSAVIKI